MKSKKRSIISPRPIAAALIQASYDTSRPLSARRMKNRGKNLFSAKLSEQIDERLPFCRNNLEIHQVYREAFQSIIEKYSNYSQSMNMLKYGYEDLIDTFVNEIKENEQKNEQIEKSQTDFKNLLHLQEKEMDDKKLYYDNLSIQVEEQIQLLTGEVDELSKQLTESKSALKEEEYLVPQKWETMTEYTQKSNKKAAKLNRLNDNYEQLKEKKKNLKISIENNHDIISKTLDEILIKKKSINSMSAHATSLQTEIEKETEIVEKKREKFKELEEKKRSLSNSIINYETEIDRMNQENIEITNYLNLTLKLNQNEEIEINDPIGLTERFVTCIRPKRTLADVGT